MGNFSSGNINVGDTTTLYCQAFSNPNPSYELVRDGSVIGTHGVTDQQVSFTIGPVSFYDDGDYKCRATNKHGFDELVLTLNISSEFFLLLLFSIFTMKSNVFFFFLNVILNTTFKQDH